MEFKEVSGRIDILYQDSKIVIMVVYFKNENHEWLERIVVESKMNFKKM